MPNKKADRDYTKGLIYKIFSPSANLTYYGSTIKTLSERMYLHRAQMKSWQAGKFHKVTAFDVLVHPDAHILLIQNYPCNSQEELEAKEGEYILANDCVNRIVPGRTKAQYREANRETRIQQMRQWYQANKEADLRRKSEKIRCECTELVSRTCIARHRRSAKHKMYMDVIMQK